MEELSVIFAFTFAMSMLGIGGWLISTWLQRKGSVPPKALSNIEERLARIEQSVDTMAIEVERISEGQRFTTKLLSERAGAER
ncbi:MAG: hypothetical protein ACREON_10275 [Gemmatimonadaceae bacterium]